MAQLFQPNAREWNNTKVADMFSGDDATLILSTHIPPLPVADRLAWARTTNDKYSVKTGYQMWRAKNIGTGSVVQLNGWSKLWKLELPHKIKLFLWRFCRNNVPVKSRLSTKGVSLPLGCPMCNFDNENMAHVLFTCPFVVACWQCTGLRYDLSMEEYAPSWLLNEIQSVNSSQAVVITRVLWEVWFFRNKKVWENKVVTAAVAMEWKAKVISE